MEKEFILSEKILRIDNAPDTYGILFCNIMDIKEFIKRLKVYFSKEYPEGYKVRHKEFINRLAGGELV